MKILLYLHSGSLNRGCEALVRSAIKVVSQRFPNAQISLASFDPQTDKDIPGLYEIFDMNSKKPHKFSWKYAEAAIAWKFKKTESVGIINSNQLFIKKISEFDIFLSIGGDTYCYGEQPIWYELHSQIKKAGKKLVLWGASIGKEDLSEEKIQDLKKFDKILVRESLTFDLLTSKGLQQTSLVADGAFLLEKAILELPKGWEEGKMVGLNYSPLVQKKNADSRNSFELLIQHILNSTDYKIVLTPHVTIAGNNDFETLDEFYQKYKNTKRVILLPDNLNTLEYKGYISRMKFFIGARTHATIAAYSSCVPTMVLGYSVKSRGIALDLFGEEKLVLHLHELSDGQKLIKKFDELVRDENLIREQLELRIPKMKQMAEKAGEYLTKL